MKILAAFLIFLTAIPSLSTDNDVFVPLASRKKLYVGGNEKVVVGTTRFLKVSDQGTHLLLFGKKPGTTSLTVGTKIWRVHVLAESEIQFLKELNGFLKTARGLSLKIDDGHIYLTGRLLAAADWLQIAELAKQSSATYHFNASTDEDLRKEMSDIWASKHPHEMQKYRVNWNPSPTLPVALNTGDADSFLRSYGIHFVTDKEAIAIELPVKVKILIAEVSRSLNRDIGIEWPQTATAQLSPRLKTPSQIEVLIKAAESKGEASVLAEPTLIARSGGEAEFLAGGEFPVRLISKHTKEVTWKKHGIYLKFKPKADISGRMKLEILTEISLIDEGLSVDNIPALKTNRISSQFDLPRSQTIVLSGLIKNLSGHSSSGIPALHRIPIIGKVFGSEKFRQEKSELAIFVTPEIVNWKSDE